MVFRTHRLTKAFVTIVLSGLMVAPGNTCMAKAPQIQAACNSESIAFGGGAPGGSTGPGGSGGCEIVFVNGGECCECDDPNSSQQTCVPGGGSPAPQPPTTPDLPPQPCGPGGGDPGCGETVSARVAISAGTPETIECVEAPSIFRAVAITDVVAVPGGDDCG